MRQGVLAHSDFENNWRYWHPGVDGACKIPSPNPNQAVSTHLNWRELSRLVSLELRRALDVKLNAHRQPSPCWSKHYTVVVQSSASGARFPGFESYLYHCGGLKMATNTLTLFSRRGEVYAPLLNLRWLWPRGYDKSGPVPVSDPGLRKLTASISCLLNHHIKSHYLTAETMCGPLRLQGGERDPTEPNLTTLPIKPRGMWVKPSWTLKTSAMQP